MPDKLLNVLKSLQVWFAGLFFPVAMGAQAIVLDRTGRVLLVEHTYAKGWHLPGGGIARGETGEAAILRELREEAGLVTSAVPELFGFYRRRMFWAENYIAVYVVRDAVVEFKPSVEIRRVMFADPKAPGGGLTAAAYRRLAEFSGQSAQNGNW